MTDDETDVVAIFGNVDPMDDKQDVYANAVPPTLGDLEWVDSDYVVGPGDILNISVLDLLHDGMMAELQRGVSNAGYIEMPFLPDRLLVRGMSTYQVADLIRSQYMPDYLLNPVVNVTAAVRQESYFSINGAVRQPRQYVIPRREFRLLEALATAGDITQTNLKYVYVIRQTDATDELRRQPSGAAAPPAAGGVQPLPALPGTEPAPMAPVAPVAPETPEPVRPIEPAEPTEPGDNLLEQLEQYMPGTEAAPTAAPPQIAPPAVPVPAPAPVTAPVPAPAPQPAVVDREAEMRRLQEAMTPGSPVPATRPVKPVVLHMVETGAPIAGPTAPVAAPKMVWAYKNGQWVRVPVGAASTEAPPLGPATAAPGAGVGPAKVPGDGAIDSDDPFGWADADMSNLARIVVIDLQRLREGDPRQNVIVRDGDTIVVPPLKVGRFYVMGEVPRPGAFDMTGQSVTVKMAMAYAGGFGQLAWPSNSVLIRRIGDDQELRIPLRLDRIMTGKEPEILLKPDDIIAVGSHIASPFLAVMRNAFRLTYGFGFVYDRNFAEQNVGQFQGFENAMGDLFGM